MKVPRVMTTLVIPPMLGKIISSCLSSSGQFDAPSQTSGLNLTPEHGSQLQIFREKRDALLGGRLLPELSLKIKVTLYNNFIS